MSSNITNIKTAKGEGDVARPRPGPKSSKVVVKDVKQTSIVLRRESSRHSSPKPGTSIQEDDCPDTDVEIEEDSVAKRDVSMNTPPGQLTRKEELYVPDVEMEPLPKKRKQGRPATTGEYYKLLERKAIQQAEREQQHEKEMLNSKTPMSNSLAWGRLDEKVADFAEEIKESPMVDVTARGLENVTVIKKWAIMCKNVKGTVKKEVSEAACFLQAAVTALAAASMDNESKVSEREGESEVDALQRQNRFLRSEILMLRAETKRLKEGGGIIAGQKSRRVPAQVPREERPQETEVHAAPPGDTMEVEVPGGVEINPVARPPIKGATKPLDKEYPPGVKEEDRCRYDELTASIQLLLDSREELKRGNKPPSNTPTRQPFSQGLPPSTTGRQYAEALKTKVPGKTDGKGKEKKNQTLKGKGSREGTNRGRNEPMMKARQSALPATNPPPLPQPSTARDTWAKVVGRKERRKQGAMTSQLSAPSQAGVGTKTVSPSPKNGRAEGKTGPKPSAGKKRTRRVPRTAAVVVTCPVGQYADAITMARQKVDISTLNIENVKARRAVTGAIVYEVPGEEKTQKADAFAAKLREVFEGMEGVRVSRPSKRADLRLHGLDESATEEEVVAEVARKGGCEAADIKAGRIRFAKGTMGTLWLQCPAAAADKIAAEGKIKIGWIMAKVEPLKTRPLQCFRCLEKGHVREQCSSATDRSGCCYNCGSPGHKASSCVSKTRCALCEERGVDANHRIGSDSCKTRKRRPVKANAAKVGTQQAQGEKASAQSPKAAATEEPPKQQRTRRVPPRKQKATASIPPAKSGEPMEVAVEEA